MGNTPPITLCVVNFNGEHRLEETFEAAFACGWQFPQVLMVDDASTDASVELVRRRFPQVSLVCLPRNAGPGAARNAGFAAATSPYILFVDNDVRLGRDAPRLLVEALRETPGALIVAPRVLYASMPSHIQYDSADCHFLGLMSPRHADRPVADVPAGSIQQTGSVVTACFLMDRARWRHGAPFDEDFGFNLEDHDFGVRANLFGHLTLVQPHATVLHGGGTPGLSYRPGYDTPPRRVFYLVRNRWYVLAKNFSWRTLILLAPALLIFECMQVLGLARKGWLSPWRAALRSLLASRKALRHKRRDVQMNRTQRDVAILRAGPLPFTAAVASGRLERAVIGSLSRLLNGYWYLVRRLI